MIVGDYLLQQAIQSGLLLLTSNPQSLEDCLRSLALSNSAKYAQAIQWFSSHTPQVILGWPMEPNTQLPIVAITLRSETETDDPIGGLFGYQDEIADDGITHISEDEVSGGITQTTFDCTVYSQGADLSVWVSLAVRWALLSFRPALNEAGLMSQSLSMGDLAPYEGITDQFVYRRTVSLSAKYLTVVTTSFNNFLTEINVYPDDPLGHDQLTFP